MQPSLQTGADRKVTLPCVRLCVRAIALGALSWLTAASAQAGSLEKELLSQSRPIIDYLKAHNYKSVGVLKFRVQKGKGPVSDSTGLVNQQLAERLELALILKTDFRQPINVVRDASAVAANTPGANHLTPEGRKQLFAVDYPLAWGNERLTPDAFLTGVAQIHADRKGMTVGILAFDKDSSDLEKVVVFDADAEPQTLVAAGDSFLVRGLFDGGKTQLAKADISTKVLEEASKVSSAASVHPLQDTLSPVQLEINYDNVRMPLSFKDGKAFVAEPQEGQKVSFTLRRKDAADKQRYAVVLRVNGENTLQRQRLPDAECRKWVLQTGDPAATAVTVRGYQMTDTEAAEFRILSKAASKAKEIDYGADLGTVSITVFREQPKEATADPAALPPAEDFLNEDAPDLAALTRGVFPTEPPKNLAAMRVQLHEGVKRGAIDAGQKIKAGTERVVFKFDPTPVMAATVVYYKP